MTSDEIDSIVQRAVKLTGDWDDQEAYYYEGEHLMKIVFSTNPFRHHNQLIGGPYDTGDRRTITGRPKEKPEDSGSTGHVQ